MGKQITEFFQKLFDTSAFPARWYCGQWSDFHGWLYVVSDLMVWSAYFAIPIIILGYIYKRKDVRFHRIYFLFAAFILSCGATHLIDALIFWSPMYRLSAVMLFVTGVLSWTTVIYLIKFAPVALTLKTAKELETEVESRKLIEDELKIKLRQMDEAQAIARMGSWEWDLAQDTIVWSAGMYNVYETANNSENMKYKNFLEFIHPEDKNYVENTISQAITQKHIADYYHRIVTPKGTVKTVHVRAEMMMDDLGEIIRMIGTGQDVSDQKKAEQELLNKTLELQEVNAGLQKFAYVASHDLQEPLRKIKTYLSLLEIKNQSFQSDEKSNGYIRKINSSASRMQQLMNDILNFSRLTSASVEFEKTNLDEVVQEVLGDMEITIISTQANILVKPLPTIDANGSQWRQLFQNLIANAIKFRKPDTIPHIEISAEIISGKKQNIPDILKSQYKFRDWNENYYWSKEKFCRITVLDHGIGFEAEYKERIFEAFERLHNLSQYEGTGIGLAICKKIVDFHHGTISAVCSSGITEFIILIPVSQANFENRIKPDQ